MVGPRSLELLLTEATVDGPVALRLAIFNSLQDAGINKDSIEGIECFSKILWYIVFNTIEDTTKYSERSITLFEREYTLKSNDRYTARPNYIFVRIYGYPLDAERETLEQTLGLYGDMEDITDDVDGRMGIKTGVRHARFSKLQENIP